VNRALILIILPAALALTAAQPTPTIADAHGGLWEIAGAPQTRGPVRQCVADVTALARFEHRGRACSARLLGSNGGSAAIEYSCGGAGFGHSEIEVLTPRSLRISTQGISGGLPFNYVLQARRVGDCEKMSPLSARH
jgi:hypothetical protein